MKLCIHRGTHQIGGIAAEISTATTRILIDMGDELSLDPNFVSAPLNIPGVTDTDGCCDAVLFTHYHGDHTGQMLRIRPEIPGRWRRTLCSSQQNMAGIKMTHSPLGCRPFKPSLLANRFSLATSKSHPFVLTTLPVTAISF